MIFETIEEEPSITTSPRIVDIYNIEEFWSFIQNFGQFSPMAIQAGGLEQYRDFFSKIEDCIILYKKIGQDFNFVNSSKESIPQEQEFDAYVFTNKEDILMQDFSNELKALKEKFYIRELYGSVEPSVFKTKQNSDLVFVLKRVNWILHLTCHKH